MLRLLLALALVTGSVQCAAACTPAASPQPSCRHHKNAPVVCGHELVPAVINHSSDLHVVIPFEAIEASTIPGIPVLQHASIAKDPSPPGPSLRLMTVLRI